MKYLKTIMIREQCQKDILDFAELLSIEFENNSNLRELYNGHTTVMH